MMPVAIFLLLLTAWPTLAVADTLTGRVVSIADGDTLTVLHARNEQSNIRLSGLDALERGQPFGTVSDDHLGERVFGKPSPSDTTSATATAGLSVRC